MKKSFLAVSLLSAQFSLGQNYIDNYLVGTPTFTTIATSANSVNMPRDLDFKPNTHELWVANKGNTAGGSMVIIYNAGETNQSSQLRMDSHTGHFMIYPSAIAFGDNGNLGNVNEIKNTAGPTSTFMGPALWSSDTSIYARVFQNNWVGSKPLGSHLDMLHQSPFAMGIAHDTANIYWVFDGFNSNLCRYDFAADHSPGYDDHSNGIIWRYSDVILTRRVDTPGHMVEDKGSGMLYIIDAGTNRLLRMNTNTGMIVGSLTPPGTGAELLDDYWDVTGATVQVLLTFPANTRPSGIDIYNGRMIIGDCMTGNINIYDITTVNPSLLGTIATGQGGVMGVKIGPDGKIWYVNYAQNTVMRVEPGTIPNNDASISRITSPLVNTFPGEFYHTGFDVCAGTITPTVEIMNTGANTLQSATIFYSIDGGTPSSVPWLGVVGTGGVELVTLPAINVTHGTHILDVWTGSPNGSADSNPANDKMFGSFRVINPAVNLPVTESFTATTFPPTCWTYIAHNFNNETSHVTTVGGFGTGLGSVRMNNFDGNTDIAGQKDYLVLPRVNLTGAAPTVALSFDVAYARYDGNTNDSLDVLVSTNCGSSWTPIYSKQGATLATTTSFFPTAFTPTASQWRQDNVSLSAYAGQADVMLAFMTKSAWGNNLYLDNINISNTAGLEEQVKNTSFKLYPNPSTGRVSVDFSALGSAMVKVADITGRTVKTQTVDNVYGSFSLDLSEQPSGTYFVEVKNNGIAYQQKLVIIK